MQTNSGSDGTTHHRAQQWEAVAGSGNSQPRHLSSVADWPGCQLARWQVGPLRHELIWALREKGKNSFSSKFPALFLSKKANSFMLKPHNLFSAGQGRNNHKFYSSWRLPAGRRG
ncbi:hypothetical protein AVEN_84383-1 [Araneus ventricosus]|uniref:Uncharacterized protein n=1 Tax=Araneus ventricosus TaxID=182803 RepID=A0A4Y2R565_ARAVE|nr:hypothetical protein AVEN_84383-1 [Araneus ventricosus]